MTCLCHQIYPFDSAKKRMETIVRLSNGGYRVYVKGASEIILGFATSYDAGNGKTVPISAADSADLVENVINGFAKQALRVICLGYRDFATEQDWEDEEALLEDLVISAFVGIQDPVRDEVPEAVKTCQHAGVIVRMLTGDNMLTARAIALNCGIITEGDGMLVMEVRPATGPDWVVCCVD